MALVEGEPSKVEGLDLHGVSDQFSGCFDLDDGVVGCHVVEEGQVVGLLVDLLDHIVSHFLGVDHLGVELGVPGWHRAVEVHVVFGEGARLVEAGEFDHTAGDDFVLGDAKDAFFLQFLNGVNDAKGHADWQSRRHRDKYQIDQGIDDVVDCVVLPVYHHESDF